MQKWTDQPATDSDDFLDFILAFSGTFLRSHASLLLKVLPPAFGFGIFLAYFARHHFYPSFDLFQFSSLLLAAACIGFGIVGVFVAALVLPGAWVYHGFLNTQAIKEDITYALPYGAESRVRRVLLLMALTFFLPYLLAGVGMIGGAFMAPSLVVWMVFLVPIPVALIAGLALQYLFELQRFSFCKYLWNAYLSVVANGYLILWMWIKAYPTIEGWLWLPKWLVLIGAPLVIAFISALCSMLFIAGWRVVILFATFFALLMAGYSGALTTLPDSVIRTLGLGNYQAREIALDQSYCQAEQATALPIAASCLLRDVHVIWSFGDSLTLRMSDGSIAWLPTFAVRSLIRL